MREREPLHNFEAEQAVLGSILADARAYDAVAFLPAEAFADQLHAKLYRTVGRLIERGQGVSPVALKGYADADADLKQAGGFSYLIGLAGVALGHADAANMARIVGDLHARRQAIETMRAAIEAAYDLDAAHDPMAPIAATADRLAELASSAATDRGARPLAELVDDAMGHADALYKRGGGLSGLGTGFPSIDSMLGGLHPSDLVILAGRPSMGKTALATNIGFNVASAGVPVGFFSLEMGGEQIAGRLIAEGAGIAGHKVRQGDMTNAEIARYMAAGTERRDLPMFVDDSAALSISTLRARARRMKRAHGIGLLIVDYLQLLSGGDRRDGRTQEISEITRGLKALAKDLQIPVLALSQLSRAVEQRVDKRPQLSDLRESGSIEQDADAVLFVYRAEYYLERSEKRGSPEHINSLGQAELIVAKQRHGPTGTIGLRFDGALTRFSDPVAGADVAQRAA